MKDEGVTQACCLVLATRACTPVWNEAGMCPGINGFTKCAPIADWSGRAKRSAAQRRRPQEGLGGAHVAVFAAFASGTGRRGSHTSQKSARYAATQWIGWAEKGLPPLTCHIPGLAGVFN